MVRRRRHHPSNLSATTVIYVAVGALALLIGHRILQRGRTEPPAIAEEAAPPAPSLRKPAPQRSTVDLVLTVAGPNKLDVVKLVREITGMKSADAEHLVDHAPHTLKQGITKEEGEELGRRFDALGATISLR